MLHATTETREVELQGKTVLRIVAHETLVDRTEEGADDSWTLGLLSKTSNNVSGLSGAPDANWIDDSPAQAAFRRSVGIRKIFSDVLPLARSDFYIMGNCDRNAHLGMQQPHRRIGQDQGFHVTATPQYLPHRMKNGPMSAVIGNSNNAPTTASFFPHFLERSNNNNFSTFKNNVPIPTGKRQHPCISNNISNSNNSNSNSNDNNNSSSSNFHPRFGDPPPEFETDHPLPDFDSNLGFNTRHASRTGPNANAIMRMTSQNSSNMPGYLAPSEASVLASVDSFLPDYDSTLYSLWTAPGSGVGYETEGERIQGQSQQTHPPLYMTADDEYKIDYSQLSEFNHDLDSYLDDTIESGASPTTPLGTSTGRSVMKMDNVVTIERNGGMENPAKGMNGKMREQQLERLLTPAAATATAEFLVRRDSELSRMSACATTRSCGACGGVRGASPASSGPLIGSRKFATESKLAGTPLRGSNYNGQSQVNSALNETLAKTDAYAAPLKAPTTSSAVGGCTRLAKRPRTRQCDFPGCQNRARSHQKCKKHGGAHQCVFEGCTKNSQSRGLCIAHGGGSRCKREGCARAAQSKGLCKSHGGGEFCAVESCNKKAHLKHLCRTHGGGVRCKFEKCSKWAQRKGWCMAHAKEYAAI